MARHGRLGDAELGGRLLHRSEAHDGGERPQLRGGHARTLRRPKGSLRSPLTPWSGRRIVASERTGRRLVRGGSSSPRPSGGSHAGTGTVRVRARHERRPRHLAAGAAGSEARLVAGGHSLLPMMKLRLANLEYLVDINDLHDELGYVRVEPRIRSASAP